MNNLSRILTRDEILSDLHATEEKVIAAWGPRDRLIAELLIARHHSYALLEILLDCREFLSEHAIAHHLMKFEATQKAIAETMQQVGQVLAEVQEGLDKEFGKSDNNEP